MRTKKLQWAAGVLAACGALALGGAWAAAQGPPVPPAAASAADETAADPAMPGKAAAGRRAGVAERTRSFNNLKGIMVGLYGYSDALRVLPTDIRDRDGKPLLSWRVAILPFIDQAELYKQFKIDEPWNSAHNKKLLAKMPAAYLAGVEPTGATDTYYQVFAGPGTPFDPAAIERAPGPPSRWTWGHYRSRNKVPAGFPGGRSATIAVVEAGPPVPWTKPADIPYDPKKPLPKLDGPFANELHAVTLDAEAHALRRDIGEAVFRRLVAGADRPPVPGLKKLIAPLPAETPEEKEALRVFVERNRQLTAEIDRLTWEQVELLGRRNRGTKDVFRAEEQGKELLDMVERLKATNKKLREEAGLGEAARKPAQIRELLVGKWEGPKRPGNRWEFDKGGKFTASISAGVIRSQTGGTYRILEDGSLELRVIVGHQISAPLKSRVKVTKERLTFVDENGKEERYQRTK